MKKLTVVATAALLIGGSAFANGGSGKVTGGSTSGVPGVPVPGPAVIIPGAIGAGSQGEHGTGPAAQNGGRVDGGSALNTNTFTVGSGSGEAAVAARMDAAVEAAIQTMTEQFGMGTDEEMQVKGIETFVADAYAKWNSKAALQNLAGVVDVTTSTVVETQEAPGAVFLAKADIATDGQFKTQCADQPGVALLAP